MHGKPCYLHMSWWRHQMETFSALLDLCVGNSPVTGEFPSQRPVTQSFDIFFDLRLNWCLSKQSWGWWFETPLLSLWRNCNVCSESDMKQNTCLLYKHKALLARVVYTLTFDWTWWDCSVTGRNWHQCPTVELKKYPWCLEYRLVSLTIVCYVYFSIMKLICLLMFPYGVLCNEHYSVAFWVGVIFAHIINEYSLLVGGTCKISR